MSQGPLLKLTKRHISGKKKKVPSVLLTCVQKKNMWAKILKKYGGLVLSDMPDQKRPPRRHGWTPMGYGRPSRKKNHVIFGLFGLK